MTVRRRPDHGFALAEVLVATVIVAVGLLGAAGALHYAADTFETSRRDTAAAFFVEQRLEALKARAISDWGHTDLGAGAYVEACEPVTMTCRGGSETTMTRTTTIVDAAGGVCGSKCKLIRVTVTSRFGAERRLDVATLVTSRT